MPKPGPYFRNPDANDFPARHVYPASFRVLETMLQYAQTLDEARRVNRRLIAVWNRADKVGQ